MTSLKNIISYFFSTEAQLNFTLKKYIIFRIAFGLYIFSYFLHWSFFRSDFDWLINVGENPTVIFLLKSLFYIISLCGLLIALEKFRKLASALIFPVAGSSGLGINPLGVPAAVFLS